MTSLPERGPEPELWERRIGSSESPYRWMLFLRIEVQRWFDDEEDAHDAYEDAMARWLSASASEVTQ